MIEVFTGAGIMFMGIVTGWAACNVTHKRYEAVEDPSLRDDKMVKIYDELRKEDK